MERTWDEEQSAAQVIPMTCFQKSRVSYIGSEVAYEDSEMRYLDSESSNLLYSLRSNLNAANQGLTAVNQWAPEYYHRAEAYSQLSGQPSNVTDPSGMLPAFNKQTEDAMTMYSKRVESFESTVNKFDDSAQALQEHAQSFPESIACSG
jgi:hypothetical protein